MSDITLTDYVSRDLGVTNGSGQSDVDYPALTSSLPSLGGMPFLGEVNHTPLPPELLQEFESIPYNYTLINEMYFLL